MSDRYISLLCENKEHILNCRDIYFEYYILEECGAVWLSV